MPISENNRKQVLLVDDEFVSNLIMKKYISDLGIKDFTVLNNGKEALEYLKKHKVLPDYIFLDLRMPIMDGFEFLKNFSELTEVEKTMKVFILTSSINTKDIERAKQFELVAGFLQKPISLLHLQKLFSD